VERAKEGGQRGWVVGMWEKWRGCSGGEGGGGGRGGGALGGIGGAGVRIDGGE